MPVYISIDIDPSYLVRGVALLSLLIILVIYVSPSVTISTLASLFAFFVILFKLTNILSYALIFEDLISFDMSN